MKIRHVLTTAGLLAIAASVVAQAPRRDGKWEVTTEMEMAGIPAMPGRTSTHCVAKKDADDPQKAIPQGPSGRGRSNNCKVKDYKVEGNKVTWSMECDGRGVGTGEFVYSEDRYTGTMKMDMGGGRGMTMNCSGKRIGDCTE